MKNIIITLTIFLFMSSCSHLPFNDSQEENKNETISTAINENAKPNPQKEAFPLDEINLEKEMEFTQEVKQVQDLNQMSYNASNKSSKEQLLEILFVNTNRSPVDIKAHFYELLKNKKRMLRKKLSAKKKGFSRKQRHERRVYLDKIKERKKSTNLKKMSPAKRKVFFKDISSERKLFFETQKDEEKVFDSNIKSYNKEIKSRLNDLTKEFKDRLKVYKVNSKKKKSK